MRELQGTVVVEEGLAKLLIGDPETYYTMQECGSKHEPEAQKYITQRKENIRQLLNIVEFSNPPNFYIFARTLQELKLNSFGRKGEFRGRYGWGEGYIQKSSFPPLPAKNIRNAMCNGNEVGKVFLALETELRRNDKEELKLFVCIPYEEQYLMLRRSRKGQCGVYLRGRIPEEQFMPAYSANLENICDYELPPLKATLRKLNRVLLKRAKVI